MIASLDSVVSIGESKGVRAQSWSRVQSPERLELMLDGCWIQVGDEDRVQIYLRSEIIRFFALIVTACEINIHNKYETPRHVSVPYVYFMNVIQ